MAMQEELLERDDVKGALEQAKQDPACAGKRLRVIDTPAGFVIVKNPSRPQWNIMRTAAWDEDKSIASKSMEGIIASCVVYPDKAKLAQMTDDFVALFDNPDVVKEFRRHCGHLAEVDAKK